MIQVSLAAVLLGALAWSEPQAPQPKHAPSLPSTKAQSGKSLQSEPEGLAILRLAEQNANALQGPMRGWALWQVARIYQNIDKKKALHLLDTAMAEVAAMKDVPPPKMQEALMRGMNAGPAQSAKSWLQQEIARTIIMIDPGRADDLLQTLEPANRGPILSAMMSYYERNKQTDRAIEQFYRIAAAGEVPYGAAARIMSNLKQEESSEMAGIFAACLTSYRAHTARDFLSSNEFPQLVAKYWRRVPKALARDAIDEIMQRAEQDGQAADAHGSFAMSFDKTGGSVGSVLEYRIVQLMPALQELEESKAKDYLERFPSLASMNNGYAAPTSSSSADDNREATLQGNFKVNGDSGNLFINAAERPSAERIAAKADNGNAAEALAEAENIHNADLRVQAFEHIARATMKKDRTLAASALSRMLTTVEKVNVDRQPDYYSSAAAIFIAIGDQASAKESIEKGLESAAQLYAQDADSDDPNRALEAFWPSTNAYCVLLRQARQLSEAWALGLLKKIDNPTIGAAAEAAMAGGALGIPEWRTRIIVDKSKSFRISLGADSPAGSKE